MFSEQSALFVIPNEELIGITTNFENARTGFLLNVKDSDTTQLGANIASVHLILGGNRVGEDRVRNHLFGIVETKLPPDTDIELYVDDLRARFKASDFWGRTVEPADPSQRSSINAQQAFRVRPYERYDRLANPFVIDSEGHQRVPKRASLEIYMYQAKQFSPAVLITTGWYPERMIGNKDCAYYTMWPSDFTYGRKPPFDVDWEPEQSIGDAVQAMQQIINYLQNNPTDRAYQLAVRSLLSVERGQSGYLPQWKH